ncbi:MAG: hypothetical protein NXY57DRAFT_229852 [Lentinula lateritia]|nr:MAG: hypothetical protein NXY57DRAFT_229852 [Lentinula lateritia]
MSLTDRVVCALSTDDDDEHTQTKLEQIVQDLKTKQHQADTLDPLTLLAHLIPSPGAEPLLEVIRERCSAKEVIVACEEWLEGVRVQGGEGNGKNQISLIRQVSRVVRLLTVITLLPRTRRGRRRRKASDTIRSFLPELGVVIRMVCEGGGEDGERENGELLWGCAELVEGIMDWVDSAEAEESHNILRPFLLSTTTSLSHVQTSFTLSQRVFGQCFPRLAASTDASTEAGVMRRFVGLYTRLGGRWSDIQDSFVLWAHAVVLNQDLLQYTPSYFPFILAAIQSNSFLDHALAVLLVFFSPTSPSHSYPDNLLVPLLTLLPALASAHPHPFIRLCAFRLLGLVLRATPGVLQIQVLVDLVAGAGSMRVAAIGLVKDLVFDALSAPPHETSILASPRFIQSLAPVLFTLPDSGVLDTLSMGDEVEMELTRLGEVLALYYVLEIRDVANRTGIRDPDNRANIERTLVAPIRSAVGRCMDSSFVQSTQEGTVSQTSESNAPNVRVRAALVALQMGVERIDEMWRARGLGVECKV